MIYFLAPNPDIVFYLNVDIDNIISRGVDEERDELIKKSLYYENLFSSIRPTNTVHINNNQPFNSVNSSLTNSSLTKLFKKHPDKLDGYRVVSFKYK